jgi:hypothetical protein
MNSLFPLFYWAPIQYYSKLLRVDKILLEQFETYPKQTYRNRCELYGPNGKQSLQVPVEKGSFHKTLIRDLKISYETAWQKNHMKSIEAAYRSSPFFEYYIDDVLPVYSKKPVFLLDLNESILEISLEWLNLCVSFERTSEFSMNFEGHDFRQMMHPKSNKTEDDVDYRAVPYMQGFEQRHGFMPNLSILDLVFNTGPEAGSVLNQSLSD